VVIVSFLHFLRSDKNLLSCFVSEYAVGNYSWLMTIAFFALTIASALLLGGLMMQVKSSKTSKITLCVFCLGILLAGIYPTDLPGNTPTMGGLIHGFAALIALLNLGISMLAWGVTFKKQHHFKKLAKPSIYFGVISLALLILFIASPIWIRGLTQRILLTCNISWLIILNRKLYLNTSVVAPSIIVTH
jgi:hypothetical protein